MMSDGELTHILARLAQAHGEGNVRVVAPSARAMRVSSIATNGKIVSAMLQYLTEEGWLDVRPLEIDKQGNIILSKPKSDSEAEEES